MEKTARGTLIVLGSVAMVAVLAGVAVATVATMSRESLSIQLDDSPFSCASGIATDWESDDEVILPAIVLTEDLDCTLRFRASNDGALPVDVTRITIPMLGPGTGGSVKVVQLDGDFGSATPREASNVEPDDIDAVLQLAEPLSLDPGESMLFTATLAFSPDGCTGENSTTYMGRAPDATVTALGIAGTRDGTAGGYAFIGTADSSCDS